MTDYGSEYMSEQSIDTTNEIDHWLYEFEIPDVIKKALDAYFAVYKLSYNDLFNETIIRCMEMAETDLEGFMKMCDETPVTDEDIHLVRNYPVYKGETEACALERKLVEEHDSNKTEISGDGM